MKRLVGWLLLATLCLAQSLEERTQQALDQVLKRKYDVFYALFSPEMKKTISLQQYASQADQIQASLGKPKSQDPPVSRQIQNSVLVTIPLHWSSASLNFMVSWNKAGQVQGTWFRPPDTPKTAYETPGYSKPKTFSTRDVTIGEDEWKLPGVLTIPKGGGPFPAVVLVHGSGPHDRDETLGPTKVFRDLAEGLATRGIAVLRYDKRTFVYKEKLAAVRDFTMTEETVDDAVRAAALLRGQKDIDAHRLFVLGHSQGGYMIPRIMKADPQLAGVIVLAGNVRPLEELIVEQTEYIFQLKGSLSPAEKAQLDALKRDPWLAIPGIPESYRTDLKGYDPAALARSSDVPMLILQGERDYQVNMKDFNLWKDGLAGRANVTLHSYPKLNHLFIAGVGKSTPQEYGEPGHLDAEALSDIGAWVLR